jgi:hypothetical protein
LAAYALREAVSMRRKRDFFMEKVLSKDKKYGAG